MSAPAFWLAFIAICVLTCLGTAGVLLLCQAIF